VDLRSRPHQGQLGQDGPPSRDDLDASRKAIARLEAQGLVQVETQPRLITRTVIPAAAPSSIPPIWLWGWGVGLLGEDYGRASASAPALELPLTQSRCRPPRPWPATETRSRSF
jgi:hypothetical protein